MTISRRAFGFSAAALAIIAAAPASAQSNLSAEDQATLRQAQAYLTALTAAQGNFVETGPGGQRRTGKFWLQRPGKMRFEYTDPAGLLVVADLPHERQRLQLGELLPRGLPGGHLEHGAAHGPNIQRDGPQHHPRVLQQRFRRVNAPRALRHR